MENVMEKESVLVPIPGFKDYKADVINGKVYSSRCKQGRWLNPKASKRFKYVITTLTDSQGKAKAQSLHALIMSAHLGVNPSWWINQGLEIDHLDGNKSNNGIHNLKLKTRKEQYNEGVIASITTGRTRLKESDVLLILEQWKTWEEDGKRKSTFCNMMSEAYEKTYSCIENIVNKKTFKKLI
ncbi:HNH endonuclease [Salipaludibacillus sp. CF4.18]|uniref:HNH endonuclease n=1 Tax=Salipaludibacillus sp. CF4.18 TaxID=3373081 RepID=UPI003EE4B29C